MIHHPWQPAAGLNSGLGLPILLPPITTTRKLAFMTDVQVEPVSGRRQQRDFMQLAWRLYREDPNWIPPLRQYQQELLGYRRHPFHDFARVRTFLAYRQGRVVGRIATIINQAHNERYNEQRGFFGFFESIDDQAVADALLDTASRDVAEQGMTALRGPINPSLNYELGLLIDGFHSPPTFMMTYNHPYYQRLIESRENVTKAQDLYAFWGHIDMLSGLDEKLEFVIKEATRRFNIHLRQMERRRFQEEVRTFLDIYNASLVGTWGFVPLSNGELEHMSKTLKHLIVPEMTAVAEVDGKPVAVALGLLDYNPLIKQIDGRLFPFGFIRLLWGRRKIKRVRLLSTNVLPEYQRWGLGLVTLARLVPDVLAWGIQEAEFSWVLESNHLSYKSLKRGGAKLDKTYRIYDLDLDAVSR